MRGTHAVRRCTAVLAVLSVAMTMSASVVGAQEPEPFGLDLEGEYRMILDDDMAYKEPDFDDSSWEVTRVPTEDGHEGRYDDYDGFGWFRTTFTLPADADGLNLVLSAGYIDDADEIYLNGVLVGKSGEFPPDSDSQWFERRLYPVPSEALRYGQENVLAARINDFSGGGGWYKGPVGLFSKERLREEVYGIVSDRASGAREAAVRQVLDRQSSALAAGDLDAYLATLDASFFHDGDDLDRRRRDMAGWLETYDHLELRDTEVEVIVTDDGHLIADTNRSLVGVSGSGKVVIQPSTQEFLRFDTTGLKEVGNHSRFFRDSVDSELEGQTREFVVYLPPSYLTQPERRYPTVYMLHGINGGAREWEPREFDRLLDQLYTDGGLAETIVIFPDGESLWYIDSSVAPWRSMFIEEMLPLIDAEYRTLPQREFRGLSGVSMGGHGAFTVGWAHDDMFSSITSHMGALDLPPLVGSAAEIAANSPETPVVQVDGHTPMFLSSFRYFFDACRDDDFRFGEAAEAMSAKLTAKLVEHTAVVYPEGRHNDDCWMPHIDDSFGMHSESFRANGLEEPSGSDPSPDPAPTPDPAPEAQPQPTLPATGGGLALAALAVLATGIAGPRALGRRR